MVTGFQIPKSGLVNLFLHLSLYNVFLVRNLIAVSQLQSKDFWKPVGKVKECELL